MRARRLAAAISFLGFSAYLAVAGAFTTLSVVLCVEADGQMAIESAGLVEACGTGTPSAPSPTTVPAPSAPQWHEADATHCVDCNDVPLQLADVEHRGPETTEPVATVAAQPALPPAPTARLITAGARALRPVPPISRSTVLRI